jgi:hypothetical protein
MAKNDAFILHAQTLLPMIYFSEADFETRYLVSGVWYFSCVRVFLNDHVVKKTWYMTDVTKLYAYTQLNATVMSYG